MVGRLYGAPRAAAKRRGAELLERFDLTDAGGPGRRAPTRAACAAAWTSPRRWWPSPPWCSWTSRRRGWIRAAASRLWETIEGLVSEGTTVLLTTQYLDEADRLADSITVIDHGQVIASGTSDELKDRVGGERVEVDAGGSRRRRARGRRAGADVRRGAVRARTAWSACRCARARGVDRRGGAAALRRRGSASTTSTCAGRRWTTCSCRSPATPPRSPPDSRGGGAAHETPGHRHR